MPSIASSLVGGEQPSLVSRLAFNPFLTGAVVVLLRGVPEKIRNEVLSRLSISPSRDLTLPATVAATLFVVGLASRINAKLSDVSANAGRWSQPTTWNWQKEIAVVTGGCSGIGQCIVANLVARNVKVAILDVQSLPNAFQNNPKIRLYQCDVTAPEDVAAAAVEIRKDLGHPTILVNNAGITKSHGILDAPHSAVNKIFAVNTISHWITVKEFVPNMVANNHGHIVTIASVASFVALPKFAEYSATKAAALSFHESLNIELKHVYNAPNVMTTVIHPNFVSTPLISYIEKGLQQHGVPLLTPEHVAKKVTDQIFSKRAGQVIIPQGSAAISGIRSWPTWLQNALRSYVGKRHASLTP